MTKTLSPVVLCLFALTVDAASARQVGPNATPPTAAGSVDGAVGILLSGEIFKDVREGKTVEDPFRSLGLTKQPAGRLPVLGGRWTLKDATGDLRVAMYLDKESSEDRGAVIFTPATPQPIQPTILTFWLNKATSTALDGTSTLRVYLRGVVAGDCHTEEQLNIRVASGAMESRAVSVTCAR